MVLIDDLFYSHGSFTRSDTDPDIRREDPVWQYFVHRFATVQCPATVICCLCDNDEVNINTINNSSESWITVYWTIN